VTHSTESIAELSARAELIAVAAPIAEGRIPGYRVTVYRVMELFWGNWPYPTIDLLSRMKEEPGPGGKCLLFAECNREPLHWQAIALLPATPARLREIRKLLR
jgi:hypothetical protein